MKALRTLPALLALLLLLGSCQESKNQRFEREAREYTQRNCPQPITSDGMVVLDSMVFHDDGSNDLIHYYTFNADTAVLERIRQGGPEVEMLRQQMLQKVKSSIDMRHIKDAGLNIIYDYRTPTGAPLTRFTFTKADYE